MKLLIKVLIFIAALILIFRSINPDWGEENPLTGKPAPDFTLTSVSGQEINMTKYRDGKPIVIFFWATWCPTCENHLKALARKKENLDQKGIKMLTVDVGESTSKVSQYLEKHKIFVEVALDQTSGITEEYHVIGVPTFFYIDQDGIVAAVKHFPEILFEDTLLSPPGT